MSADLHKSTCPVIIPACNCDLPLDARKFAQRVLADPVAALTEHDDLASQAART